MKGGLVVAAAIAVLAYITYNSLTTEGLDPNGLARGTALPPFAMPLAERASARNANVATRADQGELGAVPA